MTIEEHGAGKQLVRFRAWPRCPTSWVIVPPLFATLAIEQAIEHVWAATAVLGVVAVLLALQVLLECSAASAAVLRVLQESTATTTARSRRVEQQAARTTIDLARNRTITPAWRGDGIMAHAHYSDVALYRRLLRQVRPYRLHIAGIFLLFLLDSPLALLTPLPLTIAVDSVVGSHHLPGFLALLLPASATRFHTAVLLLAAGLFVAITLASQLQNLASSVLSTYTGERLVLNFRTQLFGHVQRLSLAHHDTQGTADSTYRIQYDAMAIQTIAVDGVIPFISAAFTLAGMIYITARRDWQLPLVFLTVSPVLVLVARANKRRLRSQSRDRSPQTVS